MKKFQKGMALIFSLFVLLAISSAAAGLFLSMARQQRMVQRSVDRLEAGEMTRSIIDRGHKFFVDYIKANGTFPPYEDSSKEVYADKDKTKLLSDFLEEWFTGVKADPEDATILADLALVPDSFSVRQVSTSSDPAAPSASDAWRRYEIIVKIRNTVTGGESTGRQTIRASCGKLFDFMAFFDGDLEVNSGPSTTVQGPLFSNGNIFLMTNAGNTLNLKMPAGTAIPEKYIMRSAKNIYYDFKRVIGQNYFLVNPDPAYSSLHQSYRAAAARIRTGLSGQVPFPGYGELNGLEILPSFAPDKDTRGFDHLYVPIFYYFMNGAGHRDDSKIILLKEDGSVLKQLAPPYPSPSMYGFTFAPLVAGTPNTSWMSFKNGTGTSPYNYSQYPGASMINMSTGFDVKAFPQPILPSATDPLQRWDYREPEKNVLSGDPATNPNWPYNSSTAGGVPISVGVPQRSLPIGDTSGTSGTNTNHRLIEPLKSLCPANGDDKCVSTDTCDCADLRSLKFETQADIKIKCVTTDTACGTHTLEDASGGELPCEAGACDSRNLILKYGTLYDYRLGGNFKTLDIDMEKLRLYLQGLSPENRALVDTNSNGIVLYVETKSVKDTGMTAASVRLVRLLNGAKAPSLLWGEKQTGFSIFTNGRLWIQGDFNNYSYNADGTVGTECSYANLTAGTCRVPPAAIFSDSVGLLSSRWTDNATAQPLISRPAGGIASRTKDVNIFAAIVTGYLYSQLEPVYPDCLKNEIGTGGCEPRTWAAYGVSATFTKDNAATPLVKYVDTSRVEYQRSLDRLDNRWPAWAKQVKDIDTGAIIYDPLIPVAIAGPENASNGALNLLSAGGVSDFDDRPAAASTYSYPAGETPPVGTPPVAGIRQANLQQQEFFGRSYLVYRCEGYARKCAAGGSGSGETGTDPGASCSNYCSIWSGYRALACPAQPVWDYLTSCDVTTHPVDSDGFLTAGPNAVAFNFDHNGDNVLESHFQVRWGATGWPGSNAAQGNYADSLIFINKNASGTGPVCYTLTGDGNSEPQKRDGWAVAKTPGGDYFFIYDNQPYTCGGVTPTVITKPYVAANYPGQAVLEPVLRPNISPALRYWGWYHQPLYYPRYSGGFENIINLQEDWNPSGGPVRFNFSGVLTSPWKADEMVTSAGRLAYFYFDNLYQAPVRNYDYNETFLNDYPPGTPGVYAVAREKYDDLTDAI